MLQLFTSIILLVKAIGYADSLHTQTAYKGRLREPVYSDLLQISKLLQLTLLHVRDIKQGILAVPLQHDLSINLISSIQCQRFHMLCQCHGYP